MPQALMCICAARKLSAVEITLLEQIKKDNVYTCGSQLFPPDHHHHHLMSTVIVRIGMTCQSPLESTYYGALLLLRWTWTSPAPGRWVYQAAEEDVRYSTVYVPCVPSIGKEAKTSAPNNVVKSSKCCKITKHCIAMTFLQHLSISNVLIILWSALYCIQMISISWHAEDPYLLFAIIQSSISKSIVFKNKESISWQIVY